MRKYLLLILFLLPVATIFGQSKIIIHERLGVDRINEPVTFGIPFKKSELLQLDNLVIKRNGQTQASQFSVTSYWDDGSIRWVKADMQVNAMANTKNENYTIHQEASNPTTSDLNVVETTSSITVNTGKISFDVSKTNFNLFNELFVDLNENGIYESSERLVNPGASVGAVVSNGLIDYSSNVLNPANITVEELGPMRVTIKVSGMHSNGSNEYLKYETRIYAYANKGFVRVVHTYANNVIVSLGQSGDPMYGANVDDYYLETKLNLATTKSINVAGKEGVSYSTTVNNETVKLIQNDRNTTASPYNFVITIDGQTEESGSKSEGWVSIDDGNFGVAVGISNFWEKYPKGISMENGGLIKMHSVADQSDFLYNGMGTSDDYIYWFMPSDSLPSNQALLRGLIRDPLIAQCESERFSQSEVFYTLNNCYDNVYPNLQDYIKTTSNNHLANRENLDLYGNLIFGDVPREVSGVDPDNIMESIWGNNYYDCNLTAARLLVMKEDAKFFDILKPMSKHWMETDCWNTEQGDAFNGYCGAYSLNHRSNQNFNHHYGEGIWYYYYLTGDERAKEIGLRAANSIDLEQWWGNENVLLRGATLRGSACLEAYKATGDTRFLLRARQQIDAVMDTQNQYGLVGSSMESGADIQGSQTFMMGLFSDFVWKYLQEDFDEEIKDKLVLMADFVNLYARVPNETENYYNFWFSPELPGVPQAELLGSLDDYVYWNSKGLIAGLYAYAYYFTNDEQYKTLGENLINVIYGTGYDEAFGMEFWSKASAQGMRTMLHAASILCESDIVNNNSNLDLREDCILLYPNPVNDYFTITGNLTSYVIHVLDVGGNVVMTIPSVGTTAQIDTSMLGVGAYFLRAIHAQNNALQIEKFIKM